jgi:hypothetical protein
MIRLRFIDQSFYRASRESVPSLSASYYVTALGLLFLAVRRGAASDVTAEPIAYRQFSAAQSRYFARRHIPVSLKASRNIREGLG